MGRGTPPDAAGRRRTPPVPSVANPLTHRMHKGINTTVDEGQTPIPVAFHGSQDPDVSGGVTHPVGRNQGLETCAQLGMAVRRLTPREAERLQGFPDDFTRIPWRGKDPEDCPDGHRYRALGNSMAVNVMRWIGERIAVVDEI